MAKFTVSEMSKKYGIARTSIYDRMKNGTLSYEIDDKNRKVIDTSEMQRVYGTPNSKRTSQPDSKETDSAIVEFYKQTIEELKRDKTVFEERERRMYKEIDHLKDKIDNLILVLGYTPLNNEPDSTNEQSHTTISVQESVLDERKNQPKQEDNKKTLVNRLGRGIRAFLRDK